MPVPALQGRMPAFRKLMLAILAVSTALAFALGYLSREIAVKEALPQYNETPAVATPQALATLIPPDSRNLTKSLSVKLVAVDNAGEGAIADLIASMAPGNGYTWIRIDRASPLINPDTQTSLRNAVDITKDLLGINLSDVDFFYGIVADSNLVGGRSAGAAIAVATIALVRNEFLRNDVLVTGTVESEGRIGEVGMILPKAKAAKEKGFKLLLVPIGESRTTKQKEECREEVIGNTIFRECRSVTVEVSVADEVGIEVREVSNVMEAYGIMKAPD